MPAWPPDITQTPVFGSFSETPQPNVLAFRPEAGAPKFRRRSTAVGSLASATFEMTDADLEIFRAFFEFDCTDGSLPFEWVHPKTGQLHFWAFESEPQIAAAQYNWNTVNLSLRRLP